MSERGLPIADGANACPFVAFEDDRDERAAVPDHRHRCYADVRPAPRALAHQEAYCLSSAFPVCPTFQDWARRESARARDAAAGAAAGSAIAAAGAAATPPEPSPEGPMAGPAKPEGADVEYDAAAHFRAAADPDPAEPDAGPDDYAGPGRSADADIGPDRDPDDDEGPRRNPPRDWSAPPPWLASAEGAHGAPAEPPDFLAARSDPARGLAGSAADLLAGGSPRPVSPSRPARTVDLTPPPTPEPDFEERDLPRPVAPSRRPRAYDQHLGGPTTGPNWERPRRYEAYPTIKTRMGLPPIPRLAGMAGAIALAAVALFFLPALLGVGGGETPTASRSPSPSPSRSIAPTATAAPTATVYIIKPGDTLSKIAVANGLSLEELRAANPGIKDPNKIVVGQEITIPAPAASIPSDFGGSAEPSP